MKLRPFFSYYGGKWTLAPRYPKPEHDIIIEPFAGSAGYATRYADREVVLVERFAKLAAMWRWLVSVSVDEVMALPLDPSKFDGLKDEAKTLIGFWLNRGTTTPRKQPSAWMRRGLKPHSFWGEYARARVANQVEHIRHWRVIEGDYTDAPDVEATWFVDPPYVGVGRHYLAKVADYAQLAAWCRVRRGLTIVCEAEGADWLPFRRLRAAKSIARGTYGEVAFVQHSGNFCLRPHVATEAA